ncbi:hypothetical protein TNCT_594111 [Trichonephila clavata]|uniref:Uncharacterized protein n=1 Tax=Trichonephila clavata TaxID=2740835 RepID=A0A8X6KDP1_TRICU|nr:hypothetical protein TNCT_594111 [Trichonephila clavata]
MGTLAGKSRKGKQQVVGEGVETAVAKELPPLPTDTISSSPFKSAMGEERWLRGGAVICKRDPGRWGRITK